MGTIKGGPPKWAKRRRETSNGKAGHGPWWKSTSAKVVATALTVISTVVSAVATDAVQKIVGIDSSTSPKTAPRTSKGSTSPSGASSPLTWTAHPLETPCEAPWVAPRSPSQIDALAAGSLPDNSRNWQTWRPAAGGASASPGKVEIFVKGKPGVDVFLTGLHVTVLDRRPPLMGTVVGAPCGDATEFRWLDVDLDYYPTRVIPHYDAELAVAAPSEWRRTPIKFPYKISASASEGFLITARTKNCDCAWIAKLSWSSTDGRSDTIQIDDHGKPFRTTSDRHLPTCNLIGPCSSQQK